MGAEIGNSTQKLHARGPIGLRELTTFKYVVEGYGQVRGVARCASAILGGAFNPPHIGHLICAQEALLAARARHGRVRCRSARRRTARSTRTRAPRRGSRCVELAIAGDERFRSRGWRSTARARRTRSTRCASCASAAPGRRAVPDPRRGPGGGAADLARARGGAGAGHRRGGRAGRRVGSAIVMTRPACAAATGELLRDAAGRRVVDAGPRGGSRRAGRSVTWCPTRWRHYIAAERPVRRVRCRGRAGMRRRQSTRAALGGADRGDRVRQARRSTSACSTCAAIVATRTSS